MTKRDFELIARVVRNMTSASMGYQSTRARLLVAENFSGELSVDHPRFDRARFLKACGVESGE